VKNCINHDAVQKTPPITASQEAKRAYELFSSTNSQVVTIFCQIL